MQRVQHVCYLTDMINNINPIKAKLNPICQLLALLGAHHIFHVSRVRVNINKVELMVNILS